MTASSEQQGRGYLRAIGEMLLLALLAGLLLIAVILISRQVFDDEKSQYFVLGYYCAVHSDLARWIWKRLGLEKRPDTDEAQPRKSSERPRQEGKR